MNISKYIEAKQGVCHGQPVFKDTRIMVYLILELLEAKVGIDEILSDDYYPQLTHKHIQAALHYAAELMKSREFVPFSKV